MNISRRREPQSSRQLRRKVAGDIAKKITGDDHPKLARIAHQFRGQSIDIKMPRLDLRIFAAHLCKDALPELVTKGEGIRFIAHQHFAQLARVRIFKGVADDALDAAARVDVFLNGDFFGIAAPELPARSGIEPFGVFAKNDKANIVFAAIAQRRQRRIEQLDGTRVHIKIELGAQPQKNIRGVTVRRHARIADGAEENSVEVAPEHFHGAGGKRGGVAQEALRAPVELHEFSFASCFGDSRSENPYGFRYDFPADAIAGNDRNAFDGSLGGSGSVHKISVRENWMRLTLRDGGWTPS